MQYDVAAISSTGIVAYQLMHYRVSIQFVILFPICKLNHNEGHSFFSSLMLFLVLHSSMSNPLKLNEMNFAFSDFSVYSNQNTNMPKYVCTISTSRLDLEMTAKSHSVLFTLLLLVGGVVSELTTTTYPAVVSSECSQYGEDPLLTETLRQVQQQLDPPGCKNRSCQEILSCSPSAPSGYYQIRVPNCSLVQVYCDMEGTNCGGEGGWTRVAHVNMSQSGATCPQGLTQTTFSGLTLCSRNGSAGCQSTVFSTLGLSYSQVCGQLRGYQYGRPEAFLGYFYTLLNSPKTINNDYVDGASITYGSAPSRKHIWTYANGVNLVHHYGPRLICPCNLDSWLGTPPFVGSDYYCETGDNGKTCCGSATLYPNDPLWDGQQCPCEEAPCCTHPNMPWFNKTLSETTTEDIELRVCGDQNTNDEDTPLEVIELFVR